MVVCLLDTQCCLFCLPEDEEVKVSWCWCM